MNKEQNQPLVFAQITKIDEEKRLVFGRAVQGIKDRVGETFDYTTSKPFFEKWSGSQSEASMGKSMGNIRAMHKDVAAGVIVPGGLVFHGDEEAIDVCAKITDDQEWEKCLTGTYTGFSIGGKYEKKWEDAVNKTTRYTANPSEISLVDRPCVGTATFFEIQKADGSVLKKNFATAEDTKVAVFQNGNPLQLGSLEKAETHKVDSEIELDGRTFQITKIEDNGALLVDEVFNVTGTPQELGAFAKALADKKLTIAGATELLLKHAPVEEVVIVITDDAVKAEAIRLFKAAAPDLTEEAIRADKAKLDQFKVEAKKTLSKVAEPLAKGAKFADEKNRKYPIDSAAHVQAALSYIGMKKNAARYSEEDLAAVKDKINAAAKSFGIDVGKVVTISEDPKILFKGLRECGQLAYLIDGLCTLAESCEMEAVREEDNSPVCAKLYNCIDDLGGCLVEMVKEEVAEEVSGGDQKTHLDQAATMLAMSERLGDLRKRMDDLRGITPEVVAAKAIEMAKLDKVELKPEDEAGMKKYGEVALDVLRKAGARHSKADLSRVQAVHDHAVGLGAQCAMDKAEDRGGVLDSGNPAKLAKGDADALAKALTVIETQGAQLTNMATRLAKIEAQPMPIKGTLRVVAVSKAEDNSLNEAERLANTVAPVLKTDGSIDEVATAMKMTLAKGGVQIAGAGLRKPA